MYNLTWGLALVFFFLGFLLFLLKQRQRYFEYHPQSWRMVVWGVILLVLAGGANLLFILYQTSSAFNASLNQIMPGVEIFGYVTGGGLVLAGFLKWSSSLLEAKKNATRRLRQLACLNSLLSVINHRQEPDQILKESLANLLSVMGYKMGVIFKPTFNSSEMTVAAHAGVPVENLFALFDLYSKNIWYKESIKSKEVTTTTDTKSLPEYGTLFSDQEHVRSFACVPIKFGGRLLGLMGFYDSRPDRFSYQEIQFLTTVGEILGVSAKQTLTSTRNKKRRDYISALENTLKINQEAGTLEESFPRISAELKKIIDFDQVSLVLAVGTGKNMKRISIGTSGGMLVDRWVDVSTEGGAIGQVVSSGEMWLDRHIETGENSSLRQAQGGNSSTSLTVLEQGRRERSRTTEDSLWKACGIKSRIILPLEWGESIYGALSLGHQEPNFYSANDAKWLKPFALGLSHLVLEQALKEKLARKEFLSRSLLDFEQKLAGEEDLKTLVEDVALSLTLDLPKSLTRVSLLSQQRDQLITCACHQIRSEGIELKKEERLYLDDLPWHRLALGAKRSMLINQDDPESLMSRKEAQLVFDEKMNSALLVPLILNDKAVGIISVGEMRNWDRQPLTEEEIAFVKHKANQICVALQKGFLFRSNKQLKDRLKSLESPEGEQYNQIHLWLSDLSCQINNPLASIRGSAELLGLSEPNLSAESLKYIKNIEKGVDRIHQSLEKFLSSTDEEKESRVGQLTIDEVVSG